MVEEKRHRIQTCTFVQVWGMRFSTVLPKDLSALRSTGGVRSLSSLVRRADSHMKPRGANRTPSASLFAAAPAHLQSRVVRSEAERTGVEMRRFGFALHFVPHPQMRGYADLIFEHSAAGRQLPDFVGSA